MNGFAASPKFKIVTRTTELLTLNNQNLYEKETVYRADDQDSNRSMAVSLRQGMSLESGYVMPLQSKFIDFARAGMPF